MKKLLFACLALAVLAVPAFSGNSPRRPGDSFNALYPRIEAVGGPNAAFIRGLETLQTNPAGLIRVERQTGFTRISTGMTGPVFSLGSTAQAAFGDPDILLSEATQDLLQGIYSSADVGGPLGFGFVGDGVGFSVYNTTGAALTAPTPSSIRLSVSERLAFRGGYAADIPLNEDREMQLAAGFALTAFVQGETRNQVDLLDVLDLFDAIGLELVTDAPFVLESGVGLNLGLLWDWRDTVAVGLTAEQVYAPTVRFTYDTLDDFIGGGGTPERTAGRLPLVISTGARYTTPLGPLERFIDRVDLYFGYRDIFDFIGSDNPENILLKLSLASEITLLDIVTLGAGFSQGLPSLGAGISLGAVDVSGAVYGREYSREPGLRSLYNVALSVDIRR